MGIPQASFTRLRNDFRSAPKLLNNSPGCCKQRFITVLFIYFADRSNENKVESGIRIILSPDVS